MQPCTGRSISKAMEPVGLQGWHEAWREQIKFCGIKWTCLAVYSMLQPSSGQTQHKHKGWSEYIIQSLFQEKKTSIYSFPTSLLLSKEITLAFNGRWNLPAGLQVIELTSDFQGYFWKIYFLNGFSTKKYKKSLQGYLQ